MSLAPRPFGGETGAGSSIADANGGNRVAGTSGYDAPRDYDADKLRKAPHTVTPDPIDFVEGRVENSPPKLNLIRPRQSATSPTRTPSLSSHPPRAM